MYDRLVSKALGKPFSSKVLESTLRHAASVRVGGYLRAKGYCLYAKDLRGRPLLLVPPLSNIPDSCGMYAPPKYLSFLHQKAPRRTQSGKMDAPQGDARDAGVGLREQAASSGPAEEPQPSTKGW